MRLYSILISIMHTYEIEIKSLLGDAQKMMSFKNKLFKEMPDCVLSEKSVQLNHYFTKGSFSHLCSEIQSVITKEDDEALKYILKKMKNISVRTRKINDRVLLVIKASVDNTTSENGVARIEREITFKNFTLEQLDAIVCSAGYEYQAKWSREREEYKNKKGICVTIDRNAGYGYVAEFEKVIEDEGSTKQAEEELRAFMKKLGVEELPQDRLERMFTYYNEHWEEYYGTDKTFIVM